MIIKQINNYLHCDHSVVNDDLFRQKISSDRRLVLIGEAFVHVLVHERRFANAAVAKNDHLQQNLFASSHCVCGRDIDV